jgi:hypothetical protein
LDIISLYEDVARDQANKDENGYLSYAMFNRMLQRASNRTLGYITGDSSGVVPPLSYSTQKAKDFIAFLITKYPAQIVNGVIQRPADYYSYENLYTLELDRTGCEDDDTDCDEDSPKPKIVKYPVDMLDGQQFYTRTQTYIKGLKPSPQKAICKMVGNTIEFEPAELGSCVLEYIRYPIAGQIKTMIDPIYYNVVADPATSVPCEWGEWARQILIFFITDSFANHIREQALKQFNMASGQKLPE